MTCPDCHGEGRRIVPGPPYDSGPHMVTCAACQGGGLVCDACQRPAAGHDREQLLDCFGTLMGA